MHEMAFAQKIIEEARKQGDVVSITVEVGELAHVPADDLRQTLQSMTSWCINISETPSKIKCACGFSGSPNIVERGHDTTIYKCSNCGHLMPEIVEGKDISLKEVTLK